MKQSQSLRQAAVWLALFASIASFLTVSLLTGCKAASPTAVTATSSRQFLDSSETLAKIIGEMNRISVSRQLSVDSVSQTIRQNTVVNERGDTLRHDTERTISHSTNREILLSRIIQAKTDTILQLRSLIAAIRTDSIPVPYPVERRLSPWQQTKQKWGGISIVATLAMILAAAAYAINRLRLTILRRRQSL